MSGFQIERDPITLKPILKVVTSYSDVTRNALAPTVPADSGSTLTFTTISVNSLSLTNALETTLDIIDTTQSGIAVASKAVLLDANKDVNGIGTLRCAALVINGVTLNISIFSGIWDNIYYSTLTPGTAKASKALVLDSNLSVGGINVLNVNELVVGRRKIANGYNNNVSLSLGVYRPHTIQTETDPLVLNTEYKPLLEKYFIMNYISMSATFGPVVYSRSLKLYVTNVDTVLKYSYDSYNWTTAITAASAILNIIWIPELGMFIAVCTGYIYRSTDGINWTTCASQSELIAAYEDVAYMTHVGRIIVLGERFNLYSTDGITWYNTDMHNLGWTVNNITYAAFCKTAFISTSDSVTIYKSNDGIKWTQCYAGLNDGYSQSSFAVSNELGVVVVNSYGSINGAYSKYTKDGIYWYPGIIAYTSAVLAFTNIEWISQLGIFVTTSRRLDSGEAYVHYSYNGITWLTTPYTSTGTFNDRTVAVWYGERYGKLMTKSTPHMNLSRNFGLTMHGVGISCSDNSVGVGVGYDSNYPLSLGSTSGKMVRFINTTNTLESTITLANNVLSLNASCIRLDSLTTFRFGTSDITTSVLQKVQRKMSDMVVSNLTPLKLALTGSDTSLSGGVLSVDKLYVDSIEFSISGNNTLLPSTRAGVAVSEKLAVMNDGKLELTKVTASRVRMGYTVLTSEDSTSRTLSLDKLDRRYENMHFSLERSSFYNTMTSSLVSLTQTAVAATAHLYYIKDLETMFALSDVSFGYASGNTTFSELLRFKESTTFTTPYNLCYIPHAKRLYVCCNSNMVFSDNNLTQWRHCYFGGANYANGSYAVAYSPELRLYVTHKTSIGFFVSKDGISFAKSFNTDSSGWTSSAIVDLQWISAFGVFVALSTTTSNLNILYSYDGYVWQTTGDVDTVGAPYKTGSATGYNIAYSEALNIAVTSYGNFLFMTKDGVHWEIKDITNNTMYGLTYITWEPELGLFLGAAQGIALVGYSKNGANWRFSMNSVASVCARRICYNASTGNIVLKNSAAANTTYIHVSSLFKTDFYNPSAVLCERESIQIDNVNNRVGLGKTPEYALELSEDKAYKPTSSSWAYTSDERLKEDIQVADIQQCYNTVQSIPLKRYTWKQDVYSDTQVNDRSQLGWIAQDVQPYIPKAVTSGERHGLKDALDLNTDQLIANLYGAVQYLQQKNDALDAYFV